MQNPRDESTEATRDEAAAIEGATTEPTPAHGRDGRPGQAHTTFLLIRHAESEANAGGYFGGQSDSPLTERGVQQAQALCDALAAMHIDAVYSSDLRRARETVAPLASKRGLELVEVPALRERSMGDFTGRSFEWMKQQQPELWRKLRARDPDARAPGGDSHRDLYERAVTLTDALRAKHRGQTVAMGTHGGLLHHLARALLGAHDLGLRFYFTADNASVTRIDLMDEGYGEIARLTYANRVALPLF